MAAILAWQPLPLLAAGPSAKATVPLAHDLRAESAAAARQGQPLVILFSRSDCPYCEEVRRDHLAPLAAEGPKTGFRVVQVDQDSAQPLTGFSGEATTHDRFAVAEKVRLVPVVAFYGPDGKRLSETIVGARLPDFYGAYLEKGMQESQRKLRNTR